MSAVATPIEVGAVLRRHDRAMQVVLGVDDEAARWTLLETVVIGNPQVEAALEQTVRLGPRRVRGVRPDLTERHRMVVRMRNEGLTFREIGERIGITEQGASYAYRACLKKLTA